ncbi:MAG: hypothetical protein E7223_06780, partial [Clostridiales bacterium]|nr:hypothetical protein [Clostridiales bacterium]
MEIIKSSLIYRGLAAAWIFLKEAWNASISCRVFGAIGRFFGNLFSGSAILNFLGREGSLQKSWQDSLLFRLADWIVNLLPNFVHWLWTRFEPVLRESLILRALIFLGEKLHIVMGIFFAFLLACPQEYWSNSFSLLGAVGCAALFACGAAASGRKIRTGGLSIYVLVFGLFLVLATGLSVAPALSLRFLVFYATAFILMFLVVSCLNTAEELYTFLAIVMMGFTVAVLYGCYQSIEGVEVVLSQVDLETNEGMPGRIYSFFENANAYAQVLIILTPFYAALLIRAEKLRHKVFWGAMLLAALYALFIGV